MPNKPVIQLELINLIYLISYLTGEKDLHQNFTEWPCKTKTKKNKS